MEVRTYIFDVPTSAGDVSWVVPSWTETPVAAKFMLIATDGTDSFDNGSAIGFGVTDGTNQGALQVAHADNQATSEVSRTTIDDGCISAVAPDQTELFEATFSQWETGGVELTWSGASIASNTHKVVVTFFSGVDVEAHVSFYQQGAHVVDVGFASKLIFAGTIGSGSTNNREGFGVMSLGVCSNGTNGLTQNYYGEEFTTGQADSDGGHNLGTGFVAAQVVVASVTWEAAISNIDSSGFNIGSSGSDQILFLCLNFDDDVDSGYDTIPTSGDISITDPGFTPQIAGVLFSNLTAIDTHATTGTPVLGIGEVDSVSENSVTIAGEIGVTTMNHTSVHSSNLIHTEDADQSDIADGAFDAFTANGFDVTMATWPGSAVYFIWWAIEAAEADTLAGDIVGTATLTGDLSIATELSGDITGTATLTGDLTISGQAAVLAGDIIGTATLTGDLSIASQLAGDITGTATLTGNLTISGQAAELAGDITGVATLTGDLSIATELDGDISGVAALTGDLTVEAPTLSGDIVGVATLTGDLSVSVLLAGDILGVATLTGTLQGAVTIIQAVPVDIILTDTIKDDIFVMDSIKAELTL